MKKSWPWALSIVGLFAVAAFGMALRVVHLSDPPLDLDEAESAINALTILEHGYPADNYLGLPLYENTLTRPWPESREYEFRDTSYSDRGVAVYHGWLPLYAMAASFAVSGITPDKPTDVPHVRHELDQFRRRTVAARVPSILFAAGFLAAVYCATRDMGGQAAAAAALVVASLAEPSVRVAREARYYSATVLIATLCCWAAWAVYRRGSWQSFVLAGLGLVTAFHTHVLTFAIACVAMAMTSYWWLRRPGAWRRAGVMVAIVVLGTLPWALAVGWFGASTHIPSARSLLIFPDDVVEYLREHLPLVAIALAAAGALALAWGPIRDRLPSRITKPIAQNRGAIALTLTWLVLGAAMFVFVVPASSAFLWRMTLPVQGPAIILAATLLAGGAAWVTPKYPWWAAIVMAIALLSRPGNLFEDFRDPPRLEREPLVDAIEFLRDQSLARDTKMYAVPLHHFPLMFYSGLPIQSVAPVRSSFLDSYDGRLIIVDSAPRHVPIPREMIAAAAADRKSPISADEVREWDKRLESRIVAEDLATRVGRVEPGLQPLPDFAAQAVQNARAKPQRKRGDGRWQNPAVFRGFESYHKADFWPIFFYRFVDPAARSGDRLNYARRIRNATATILPEGWVVYDSPAPIAEASSSERLRAGIETSN